MERLDYLIQSFQAHLAPLTEAAAYQSCFLLLTQQHQALCVFTSRFAPSSPALITTNFTALRRRNLLWLFFQYRDNTQQLI